VQSVGTLYNKHFKNTLIFASLLVTRMTQWLSYVGHYLIMITQ